MTLETIDWELEAERVKRAFGLKGEARFKLWYDLARQFQLDGNSLVPLGESEQLIIAYEGVMKFTLWRNGEFDTYIGIDFEGKRRGQTFAGRGCHTIAEGLFHLGLLTPEIEAALGMDISHHQRAEWILEYDERRNDL